MNAGNTTPTFEIEALRKDGSTVFVEVNSKEIKQDNAEHKSFINNSALSPFTDKEFKPLKW